MREEDPAYLKWIHDQPEFRCVLSGTDQVDACHLKSKGAGGSDYFVIPMSHELHFALDHGPRGSKHIHREAQLRQAIAAWYYLLPGLHKRFYLEQDEDRQAELLETETFQMMAGMLA